MSKSETTVTKRKTQLTLAEQTAAFLKAGGKIEQIPSGVSGQTNQPKSVMAKKTTEPSKES
ncbi:MAG TPA: hypothetical protein QF517_00365 [Pseudomonadales bacterium]|jgi:hypothetical protein|nr:hypothetical protein [Gammaproteobacteria bacterium]MDP6025253.1 hypothetical protein [Pseudomonadales bacterium]MDP6315304.1 hypothetical protein [Pseudomonadales bacterium]MDP7314752.1 hypothetical protein [Pseudomonadales bacterium]MDP7576624.1 hypothetical protein [Pseudomonadales bacterium]|tara:strand:+ start:239 stop:421 length:183 start_codon:yes stop_codon:yes gene_type:complete